ncbi:phenylalanine--tRNA ligase subunit beta [Rhodocyclus gracilis]|uniref:Phenylalanine--tRNA ligase beta subunit n=1 Tax=Rhodocyclus tenuis TaxID=1066 RepID=A0A6L5JTV8_RHOTE|nr:phenylalanine--tRNA ligase subunit beta [Rhodocyclus gracilis]MQY50556.1 phenylalanine--tRNA ligase subunit beta [Rhodocyclus gracilis]
MKFSESWLRSFVATDRSSDELSHLLTMAGLEVEEVEAVAPAFTHVVVGHVLEVSKHPNADRLNVCRVDIGNGNIAQIVCGAPNVAAGMKVPCALPGAVLPGEFVIKVAKVRGIESSGMLCSAKELGIDEDASGLLPLAADATAGDDVRRLLDLDDRLLTLKLTPNRADCLSLTGIAREVAALTHTPAQFPAITTVPVTGKASRAVELTAPNACPRYCGRVISGVNAHAATPEWMLRRLQRSGLRPISALVDITNYVMLELGQPLHAFDNAKLTGTVRARMAHAGETLRLLNEQTVTLTDDILVIADDAKALAMAGIMGGDDSAISLETRELFLESAFFAPAAIAGRARRYAFSSDASHRFERGVDFAATRQALERASELVLAICGGAAGPVREAQAELPARPPVRLRTARVARVLGVNFTPAQIAQVCEHLGFSFTQENDAFVVTPPSYRFDIEIEEDLIEEIARLHGYDNIPSLPPRAPLTMLAQSEDARTLHRLRQTIADRGYQEVINFAFVEEAREADFAANNDLIRLANPIASQLAVMRSSLLGGLVGTLQTNLRRRQNRVRVFETGRCFKRDAAGTPVAGFKQAWHLGGLAFGGAAPEQWGSAARSVDFFDVKADLEALFLPAVARFEKTTHPALHPGRAARILLDGEPIGVIGELHPQWAQKYELPHAPIVFELELAALTKTHVPSYAEFSRQPPAIRDIALVVDQNLELQAILDGLAGHCPALVQELRLFDVYTGKGVPQGKKSLAFRIVMQDTEKTLQDTDVDSSMQKLIDYALSAFSAQFRV